MIGEGGGGSERASCPSVSRPFVRVGGLVYCFRHRSRACLARFLRPIHTRRMSLVRGVQENVAGTIK